MELAKVAAKDPQLIREVRSAGAAPVPWQAAIEMERGKQMWTQRVGASRAGKRR